MNNSRYLRNQRINKSQWFYGDFENVINVLERRRHIKYTVHPHRRDITSNFLVFLCK